MQPDTFTGINGWRRPKAIRQSARNNMSNEGGTRPPASQENHRPNTASSSAAGPRRNGHTAPATPTQPNRQAQTGVAPNGNTMNAGLPNSKVIPGNGSKPMTPARALPKPTANNTNGSKLPPVAQTSPAASSVTVRNEENRLPNSICIGNNTVPSTVLPASGEMVGENRPYKTIISSQPKFSAQRYTDSLDDKSFTRLVNSVHENGFSNPNIKYVEINGEAYIVHGNNRVRAAQYLNRMNELKFQRVDFPVEGTNFKTPQDVLEAASQNTKPLRYRGKRVMQ